jgi:hypothetical protein
MNVNDYSIRKQVRAEVRIAAEDHRQLEDLESARMVVVSPGGTSAKVRPYRIRRHGKRFKAARAEVIFKLQEDTASGQRSNVPAGYFAADGPYRVRIELPGETYRGQVSFGAPIALRVTQDGEPQPDFILDHALPIELATVPQSFGPVYYKHRDLSNAFYQLANMENSLLETGDFRAQEESPQYFFQLRAGPLGSDRTKVIDPAAYISGARHGLIRAEQVASPMLLPPGALDAGLNLLVDFSRKETGNSSLSSTSENYSQHVTVRERVIYVFELH